MPNDCGCNTTDTCYSRTNVVQQAVIPVLSNDCYGNSGVASDCPIYFEPSTPTSSAGFTVPAVGATFNLALICNASKFRLGMWVQIGSLGGKYPIVGINATTNILTLRNSCADGTTAIYGNPDPGTSIGGGQSVWLTGSDPCLDQEAACTQVFECLQSIDEDNQLCLPNIPVTTDAQGIAPWGLTVSCDAGDCPQPDDPNCVAKLDGVRMYNDTICWPDGLREPEEDEETFAVAITSAGCLVQSSGGSFNVLRIQIKEVTADGDPGPLSFSVNTADFGVPSNATAVSVRGFMSLDLDADPGDGIRFNAYLRGAGETSMSANVRYMTNYDGRSTSGTHSRELPNNFAMVIPVTPSDKTLHHEFDVLSISGNNVIDLYLWLDGYYA